MSTWVIIPKDDDVVHGFHKYLSKEWVNGKWKYIYYDAKRQAKNVKNKFKNMIGINQKKTLETANRKLQEAESKHRDSKNMTRDARKYMDKESQRNATENNAKRANEVVRLKNVQKGVQNAYDKTLLGKVDKIKNAGSRAINKVTKTIDKATGGIPKSVSITNQGVTKKYNRKDLPIHTTKTGRRGSIVKSQYSVPNSGRTKKPKETVTNRTKVHETKKNYTNSSGHNITRYEYNYTKSQYSPNEKKDTSVNSKKKRKSSQGRNAVKAKYGR